MHERCFRYLKRHLAQEDHLKENKSAEELKNSKSTIRCVNSVRGIPHN